ncbi:hypothetical protein JB92DRAFT_1463189 [Gautieria morchelliformis]|nr:hypothetical protein JB92DRAFT_1463189 [Gautieria morchelliformis]
MVITCGIRLTSPLHASPSPSYLGTRPGLGTPMIAASPPVRDMSRVRLMSITSENRGCHLYCGINVQRAIFLSSDPSPSPLRLIMLTFTHLKNSIRSCIAKLKRRTSEAAGIPILPDINTRQMPVLAASSDLFARAPPHSYISPVEAPHTPGGLEEEFDSTSASSLEQSEREAPLPHASLSSSSVDTMSLAPNFGLFRGSHDLFGFDVYISQHDEHEPPYLLEFPTVPPWDELVTALATKTGREADSIVLSSKVYPDIVDDELSYQAWLTWSRENDGLCSIDLWLD